MTQRQDIISFFAQHKVAANLLMLIMVFAGLVSLSRLNTQFFPTFALDYVAVKIAWRSASAEDVEESISTRVEQELRTVDFVKKMTSTSSYGMSVVNLEFHEGTDMGKALDQVKEQVAHLRNLPSDAEIPEVTHISRYEPVAKLLISTEGSLEELRYLIHQIEYDLLDRGIARLSISGLPKEEIAIQIGSRQLDAVGLSLNDISQRVSALSHDLPAGEIGNDSTAKQLRSLEQRRDAQAFSELVIKSDGTSRVLLSDIAQVERRAMRKQVKMFYQGKPTVELALQRTENADSLESAEILARWVEDNQSTLPKGVSVKVYDASWELIKERMDLLVYNGLGGLMLVIAILFLFLQSRVAIWVAIGIPVSFMATLLIMLLFGGSINMISLFGLIMALGIIVDDAIVVGEDALTHYQTGESSLSAAEGGARRMFAPVLASSLTTISSFIPLMMIGGIMGNILFDIPFVIICVILASLIESFFILPGHLRHAFHKIQHKKPSKIRAWLDHHFNYFRDHYFKAVVISAVKNRGLTISLTMGLLIVCIGLIVGGRLPFTFFPSPEGTSIMANARFTAGTPPEKVSLFLIELNDSLKRTQKKLGTEIVDVAVTRLGAASTASESGRSQKGERFGSIQIELISPDSRDIRNKTFISTWREQITFPAGLESFTISERKGGPPGSDLDIRFTGNSAPVLKQAANELHQVLEKHVGVSAIENDMPYGQEQFIYHIKGQGDVLGLTIDNVGQQLRAAFDGQLVQIFQDGDDEVEVRVMLPDSERNSLSSLESFMIRLPQGGSVPLSSVVDFEARRGFDVLRHTDTKLAIHVTASVDATVNNSNAILAELQKEALPDIASKYGVNIDFEGRAEEQKETMEDMMQGLVLAFILIYIILAWVFSSYGWPLVVMAAIPFGLIGALFGHWLLGIDLTILSLFGIFGLSGIVVNDSIILVSFFKQQREAGIETTQAIINASTQRLRAVLLTSLTTIGGLTPLLFETSLQAQFLIPMAVSISFGLMFATVLVLLVIPALLSIYESMVNGNEADKETESIHA